MLVISKKKKQTCYQLWKMEEKPVAKSKRFATPQQTLNIELQCSCGVGRKTQNLLHANLSLIPPVLLSVLILFWAAEPSQTISPDLWLNYPHDTPIRGSRRTSVVIYLFVTVIDTISDLALPPLISLSVLMRRGKLSEHRYPLSCGNLTREHWQYMPLISRFVILSFCIVFRRLF